MLKGARLVSLVVLSLLSGTERVGFADAPLSVEELAGQLGIDANGLANARAGQIVDVSRPELSERDLAVGFAFECKQTPDKVVHSLLHGIDLGNDPSVSSSHHISTSGAAHDLEALRLSPGGEAEAKRYQSAEVDTLNLSDGEIAAFKALPPTASQADVEAQLRKMLLARFETYRRGGVGAIVPYARNKGAKRDLGEGLRLFADAPPALRRYASAVQAALHEYPKLPAGTEEAFYWIVYNHDGRPTVTLRHRFSLLVDGTSLLIEREFYVSQGYNEMQALWGFVPLDGGTLVFYRVDTGTDRVAGSASGMKHSIGRRIMSKQLKAIFARTKAQLDR